MLEPLSSLKCSTSNVWKRVLSRSVFVFILCFLSACRETIVHDLAEFDANRLVTRLGSSAIEATKIKQPDGRWAIEVPKSETIRSLRLLDDRRLLRAGSTLPERAGITASREEQRFLLERGLSRELESTLASIDGILEARVHLNLPPVDPLFGTPVKNGSSSASVLLLAVPGIAITRESVIALVSGASGVDPNRISVLISAPIDESPAGVLEALPEIEEQQAAESESLRAGTIFTTITSNLGLQIGSWLLVVAVGLFLFVYAPRRKNPADRPLLVRPEVQ
jgi:type III secretory pathway lipoprotein EscJ